MWFKETPQYNKLESHQLNWVAVLGHYCTSFCLSIYFKLFFKSFKVIGREKIPAKPLNYVVACNHLSMMDPPIMSVALRYRPISYMAKIELFKNRLVALYFYTLGTFAVNREKLEMSTVKSAKNVLKTPNWVLAIFPEGTRNLEGKMGEAKKGVAFFAQMSKVGVLPMAIARKGIDKKEIYVKIGDFIPYDKDQSIDALTDLIQERLSQLLSELDAV